MAPVTRRVKLVRRNGDVVILARLLMLWSLTLNRLRLLGRVVLRTLSNYTMFRRMIMGTKGCNLCDALVGASTH